VTIGEPLSDHDQKLASPPRGPAISKRIIDWFWRGSTLEKARQALPPLSERAATFARRARASSELAQNMLASDEPGEMSSEGSACETYREASYWALCALVARAEPTFEPNDSELVWNGLDDALLVQASGAERVEVLRSALRSGSFIYFAELSLAEQTALLPELRKLAQALLVKLDERSIALDAIYLERAWRLALLVLLALGIAVSPIFIKSALEARSQLNQGKPWRASSKYEAGGYTSPAQKCPESPNYFFHTNEEPSPWVEFDLGTSQKIKKVQVDNRVDCCSDRADPFVVEVSDDRKHWRRVARHEGEFTTWEATFTAEARYLRLRLLHQNYFHLTGVRIF